MRGFSGARVLRSAYGVPVGRQGMWVRVGLSAVVRKCVNAHVHRLIPGNVLSVEDR